MWPRFRPHFSGLGLLQGAARWKLLLIMASAWKRSGQVAPFAQIPSKFSPRVFVHVRKSPLKLWTETRLPDTFHPSLISRSEEGKEFFLFSNSDHAHFEVSHDLIGVFLSQSVFFPDITTPFHF